MSNRANKANKEGLRSLPDLWPWGAMAIALGVLALSVGATGRVSYPPLTLVLAIGLLAFLAAVILGGDRAKRIVPAGCLAAAIVLSGIGGGLGMHLVPVFCVLCAGMLLAGATGQPPRLRWLLPAAATAGVLSLLFAAAIIRPRPDSGEGSASDLASGSTSRDPGPQPATFDRLVDAVRRALGFGDDATRARTEEAPGGRGLQLSEPDDPTNWWLLLASLIVLIAVAAVVWLLVRWLMRRAAAPAGPTTWPLIERFESVGAKAGLRRRPHQGLVDYGRRLSSPDDDRPGHLGSSLSGLLYDPTAGDEATAERLLVDLETAPPPPSVDPPPSRWGRIIRRIKR